MYDGAPYEAKVSRTVRSGGKQLLKGMSVTYRYYQIAEPTVGLDTRKLGDTKYKVYPHSMSSQEYEFTAGIFLRLPITHFDHILVKGKANSKITGKTTKLPVNLEKD